MKKILVFSAVIFVLFCIPSLAETYGGLTYTVNSDNTLTITGYDNCTTEVIIPEKIDGKAVCSIGDGAFLNCEKLTMVSVPSSVTKIGSYAFSTCRNLSKIELSEGLLSIESEAFYSCEKLRNISLPDSLITIGDYAFGWTPLESVRISEKVSTIGKGVFAFCNAEIEIDNNNKFYCVENGALYNKNKTTLKRYFGNNFLGNFDIPGSVKSVEAYAFSGANLESVTMTNSVTKLEEAAFSCCSYIKSIKLSDRITLIERGAFNDCSQLSSITLPNGITKIENELFKYCNSLETVKIPKNVTRIGEYAFQMCVSLKYIVIPDSVTSIGTYAFNGCQSLNSLTLPKSITSFGSNPFNTTVYVYENSYPHNYAVYKNLPYILIDELIPEISSVTKVYTSPYTYKDDSDTSVTVPCGIVFGRTPTQSNGWTIAEYGIMFSKTNRAPEEFYNNAAGIRKAKGIAPRNTEGFFGILFYGNEIKYGQKYYTLPYAIYENGTDTITVYGTEIITFVPSEL